MGRKDELKIKKVKKNKEGGWEIENNWGKI